MVFPLTIVPISTKADTVNCYTIEEVNQHHNEVRALLSRRSFLRMAQYTALNSESTARSSSSLNAQIEQIDKQLESLGVQQGSLSELGFSTQSRSVEIPETDYEKWYLETYNYVQYNGILYSVSVLTAESNDFNSVLYDSNVKVLYAAPGVAAGTADFLRILVTASSGIVGTIGGSVYDAVCTTISNLSSSTVIENVSATYNWQCDTLMHFAYVKRMDSSLNPELSYVYNEVNIIVKGTINNASFDATGLNKLKFEDYNASGEGIMSENANNLSNAIDSYLNYNQIMHSFVSHVSITGVGGKSVATHYVCKETYPSMIY